MGRVVLLVALACCVVATGCKRVSVRVDGDDPFRITLPMFVVYKALRFTDEDVLEIDDLGGFDDEIPMEAIAKAIRDGGDQVKVSYKQGETLIKGEKISNVFHIEVNDPEEEERVLLRLPDGLMDALLDQKNGKPNERKIKRALKRFSGVLLEVESPDERIRIVLR